MNSEHVQVKRESGGKRFLLFAVLVILGIASRDTHAQSAGEVLSATDVSRGLCVVLGNANGDLITGLTNDGKMIVAAFTLDEASLVSGSKAVLAKGLQGFVTVEKPLSINPIPIGGNVANLVVADLDALGASGPSEAEVKRVLAPYGASYLKVGGVWKAATKAKPDDMDEWTHRFHGSDGNPISQDRSIRSPSDRIRWHSGLRYGMDLQDCFVMGDGYFAQILTYSEKGKTSMFLVCRNALNGLPMWRIPIAPGRHTSNLVIGGGKLFTTFNDGSPLRAYDIKSGALVQEYPAAGAFKTTDILTKEGTAAHTIYHNGNIIVPNVGTLTSVDATSGEKKWQYTAEEKWVFFPVVDSANNRIFVCEGPENQQQGRWDGANLAAVTCLNLNTGAKLWRCTDFVGKGGGEERYPNLTQLVYNDGYVYAFSAISIIAKNGDPYYGKIRASDGAYLWGSHYQLRPEKFHRKGGDRWMTKDGKRAHSSYWGLDQLAEVAGGEQVTIGQVAMVRNGVPYVAEAGGFINLDPATGKPLVRTNANNGNKCERAVATVDYFVAAAVSMTSWEDKSMTQSYIARSACAGAATPAYGGLYMGSGWCTCHNNLRGMICLTSSTNEPLRDAVPDNKRVVTSPIGAVTTDSSPKYDKTNVIVNEWTENFYLWDEEETSSVNAAGNDISARIYEGTVVARPIGSVRSARTVASKDGSTVKWVLYTGGRISSAPVMHNGNVYVGSHNGWVYCIDPANGAVKWKFLAAPVEEKIVAFGQLESRWPVQGVSVLDGKITCVAGRHSEADGGIWAWELNPETGAVVSKVRLYSPPYKPGDTAGDQRKGLISMNMIGTSIVEAGWNRDSFRNEHGRTNPYGKGGSYAVDFSSWNGKVINPKTGQAVLPPKIP